MVFGDGPTAERAVASLNGVHGRVQGEVHDRQAVRATGQHGYQALDPELLLWVQAALLVTSVQAYRAWVGPLDAAACERFWQEARVVGVRLGIPLEVSPRSWPELLGWFEAQLAPGGPITVTPTARALAPLIIRPPLPLVPGRLVDLAASPGLSLLPERLRQEFGIPWPSRRARLAHLLTPALRTWVQVIPRSWRAMPPAWAAERRFR